MSQVLDALRGTGKATEPASGWRTRPAPGTILASMRYGAVRRRRGRARKATFIAALAACGLLALGVRAWNTGAAGPSLSPATQSEPGPASGLPPPAGPAAPQSGVPADLLPAGTGGSQAAPVAPQGAATHVSRGADSGLEPSDEFTLALEYHRTGEFDHAARLYRGLIARGELWVQAHNNLGLLLQQQGQLEEAVRSFELALTHDPRYARAHNNLGVVFLAMGRIDAASARFREAAALDRRDSGAIVNLALAQQAAGLPEQAKESLLAALGLSPRSAPAHYNLAVLYDQSGERARAAEHYRAFLEHRGGEYAARAADVRLRLAALDAGR